LAAVAKSDILVSLSFKQKHIRKAAHPKGRANPWRVSAQMIRQVEQVRLSIERTSSEPFRYEPRIGKSQGRVIVKLTNVSGRNLDVTVTCALLDASKKALATGSNGLPGMSNGTADYLEILASMPTSDVPLWVSTDCNARTYGR
jgi:hypothetical protein